MATVSATRASSTLAVPGSGVFRVAWGTYEHAANLAAADIVQYCRVPKGAVVVGGWWGGDDLDTNGTEEIDIDIGWAANGVEVADPDGFGNLGTLTGDVSVHLGAAGLWFPLQGVLLTGGPASTTFSAETILQATIITDAATGGTGTSTLVAYYYVP
jgi:hypothetical protein